MSRNRKVRAKVLLGAGLLALAHASQAAGPGNEDLKAQIEELKAAVRSLQEAARTPAKAAAEGEAADEPVKKQDLEGLRADLENYKYETKRTRETKTALTTRGTTIGGSVQTRFTAQNPPTSSGSSTTAATRNSSFDVPQATLSLAGSLFRDYKDGRNLDYKLAFGYVPNSPANNNSLFNLTDAYVRYSFLPTSTGLEESKLTATVGQQQIPFGLEAQASEDLRPVIKSAQFLAGLGLDGRQIGVIARGDLEPYVDYGFNYRAPLFEYALGVVNGSGANKSDDNGQKDWVGRVAFTLPVDYNSVLRELKFGSSVYKGKKNSVVTLADKSTLVTGQGRSDRYGFDIYYNHDPIGATFEYAQGHDEPIAAGGKIGKTKSSGYVATLYYTWGEQFLKSYRAQAKYDDWWPHSYESFIRYDQFDPNRALPANETVISTIGLNVFFAETTKFQINLSHTAPKAPAAKSGNTLLAQFQFGF